MTEQNKENQRPDAVPASSSVGAVEPKYKKGDHVWAKRSKELAGRTGYVMKVDTRRMEYEERFGTEMWIVPEDDLELVDPATEDYERWKQQMLGYPRRPREIRIPLSDMQELTRWLEQFAHVAIDPEEMKERGIIIKAKED